MNVRQSASDIEEQAARWVMRLDREGRTDSVEADLQAWLEADTRRAGALLQAEAAWTTLDRARAPGFKLRRSTTVRSRAPRRAIAAGLAAIAAAVFAVVLLNHPDTYATGAGETRRLPLADGSTASINTDTRVEVDFDGGLRRVGLTDGEAWFQVAKDLERPFRVDVGRIRVQAIGTAFSVRRLPSGVEVRVTEGVVKAWVERSSARTVEIPAGASATITERDGVSPPVNEAGDIDRELSWRSGQLDLKGDTLAQAVDAYNRYNARALILDDPGLAGERLYGAFRLDDPDGFAASVGLSLDAPVTAEAGAIRIGRRPD